MTTTRFLAVATGLLVLAGCGDSGGGDDRGSATSAPRPATSKPAVEKDPASAIKVLESKLIYLPDQTGGNFYVAFVRVRNTSKEVAINVGGQLSVKSPTGQLVKSVNPTEINVLPGQEGLIDEEAMDLPTVVKNAKLDFRLTVEDFRAGPAVSPVSFSKTAYSKGEFGGCKISGTVSNTFSEKKDDLQLRVAGFSEGKLVTGGFTYVDTVFPKQDATFEVSIYGAAACPKRVDRIGVYPNLGDDKIFNP